MYYSSSALVLVLQNGILDRKSSRIVNFNYSCIQHIPPPCAEMYAVPVVKQKFATPHDIDFVQLSRYFVISLGPVPMDVTAYFTGLSSPTFSNLNNAFYFSLLSVFSIHKCVCMFECFDQLRHCSQAVTQRTQLTVPNLFSGTFERI